ncbi:MAG TPA: ribosome-associated translation inhibitor RaiA [Chloroflexota bacterium]
MKRTRQSPGQVNVQVKGNHVTVTDDLHDQVVQKMAKLDRYLDKLQTIEVELTWEKTRDADHQNRVEATTRVSGRTLRVTAANSDMHAAIDEVVGKLYRQLNRTKERLKSHGTSKIADVLPASDESTVGEDSADVAPETDEAVIVRERVELKPLFEEEAIADMEAAGHKFYVFLNARNESVNVVYRHTDGTYGVIEPYGA